MAQQQQEIRPSDQKLCTAYTHIPKEERELNDILPPSQWLLHRLPP